MSKVKRSAKANLVGGRFRAGSTIANLFEAIRKHPCRLGELKKYARKGTSVESRVAALARHGRETGRWSVTVKDGKASLRMGGGGNRKSKPSKKASKPAAKAKSKKPSPSVGSPVVKDA